MGKTLKVVLGSSPKTSAAGLSTFAAAVIYALVLHYDGDPTTVPDWNSVFVAFGVFIAARCARDNTVTSEQAKQP